MSHEASPSDDISPDERAKLSRELLDSSTSFERLIEIAAYVQAVIGAGEGPELTEERTDFADLSDLELRARLADPNVPGSEKDKIASYILTQKHPDNRGDNPGTPGAQE